MCFIKKKNFQKDEILLLRPEFHWMFLFKPLLVILLICVLFFLFLPVNPPDFAGFNGETIRLVIKWIFCGVIAAAALYFTGRICAYLSTEYGITNRRIMIRCGLFSAVYSVVSVDKIESILCRQGFLGRIFNYGTIRIGGTGGKLPELHMVEKPFAVYRKIGEVIEKYRPVPAPFPHTIKRPPAPPRSVPAGPEPVLCARKIPARKIPAKSAPKRETRPKDRPGKGTYTKSGS
jgi:hypothetical protein